MQTPFSFPHKVPFDFVILQASCLFRRSQVLLFCCCGFFFYALCSSIVLDYDLSHGSYTINNCWSDWSQSQSLSQSHHKARWSPGLSLGLWFLLVLCKLHRKTSRLFITHHLGYAVVHAKGKDPKRSWAPYSCPERPSKPHCAHPQVTNTLRLPSVPGCFSPQELNAQDANDATSSLQSKFWHEDTRAEPNRKYSGSREPWQWVKDLKRHPRI